MKPKPVKFTQHEGTPWRLWEDREEFRDVDRQVRFHSIMFEDGTVFDMLNGWREGWLYDPVTGIRLTND